MTAERRTCTIRNFLFGLSFYLAASCQAFGQNYFNPFSNCLDKEAIAAIGGQIRLGIKFYQIDTKSIGSQILQICTKRLPVEASKNSLMSLSFAQTVAMDHLNKAMEADLRQQKQEQMRKDNEYARRVAPLLESEDRLASSRYGECLFQHARILALNSAEGADTIARASFASCRTEREAIIEVHRRYRDNSLTREALDFADKQLFDVVVLEIIQSRADPLVHSGRTGKAQMP